MDHEESDDERSRARHGPKRKKTNKGIRALIRKHARRLLLFKVGISKDTLHSANIVIT